VQNPGVEALGQNVLSTLGSFLVLLLSFVLPAVVGALVWLLTQPFSGVLAIGAAILAGITVLAGQVALMLLPLGRLLERTEPSAIV
jgi:glucan phosphoethanolaminetransferase (alkaline phosphatase superfamily)